MRRIILQNSLCPGDLLMLTAAARDLHLSRPGEFETDVRTPYPELWESNPYLVAIDDDEPFLRTSPHGQREARYLFSDAPIR